MRRSKTRRGRSSHGEAPWPTKQKLRSDGQSSRFWIYHDLFNYFTPSDCDHRKGSPLFKVGAIKLLAHLLARQLPCMKARLPFWEISLLGVEYVDHNSYPPTAAGLLLLSSDGVYHHDGIDEKTQSLPLTILNSRYLYGDGTLSASYQIMPAASGHTPYSRACTNCAKGKCKCIVHGNSAACER